MAYVKNIWVDREGTTRYHETVDEDGALIFTPDYEKVTEIGTPVNADNMNHIEEGIEDHENRITVLEEAGDASNFLTTSQITNCITEIPQRVKLEINNGVLTLKAGSQVIVPNGFEADGTTPKFDYVVATRDFSNANETYAGGTEVFLFANVDNGEITSVYTEYKSKSFSGTVTPTIITNYDTWYDTNVNLVKRTTDNGATWGGKKSLPLNISYRENGLHKSLGEVFNGMGYIGSTQWYDKDIVGLSPNGLNPDGTYNNAEIRRTRLTVRTFGTDSNSYNWQLSSNAHRDLKVYYVQDTQPALSGNWLWHDTLNNKLYGYTDSTGLIDMSGTFFVGGFGTRTNGVVTSFNPKQTFRAVDWYDFEASINDFEDFKQNIIDLEIGKPQISLDSNLPSNCVWLEGSTVSRTTYANLFAIYGTTYGEGDGSITFKLPDFRNRAIWGSNGFGYLSAGLPNITGKIGSTFRGLTGVATGAFSLNDDEAADYGSGAGSYTTSKTATFNASNSNAIYGGSTTVQPPAIKVRVYARYQ